MEQQKTSFPSPGLSGVIPMVRIDGARVRRLRESKGLTQLYLSTVVGVTTDTISRWENRHYQSIKLDNAEKLAAALEVSLEEILERPQAEQEPALRQEEKTGALEEMPQGQERRNLQWLFVAATVFAVAVIGLLLYVLFPRQPQGTIAAERILPPQAPPGQTFPVMIRVRATGQGSTSLILKETLPPGSSSPQSVPGPTTIDLKENSLKWISRIETGQSVYTYLCQVPSGAPYGETLSFRGIVTRKQAIREQEIVTGSAALTVAPFHWADANRDQAIDDEEILAVYDLYSDMEWLDLERDLIDSLWAAGGYRWDEKKKEYAVQEEGLNGEKRER